MNHEGLVQSAELICRALAGRRRLSFVCKGTRRMVDPYSLGADADGALILSAVQRAGRSGTGFRGFAVTEIAELAVTDDHSPGNHRDYNPRDRLFARVLCRV